MVEQLVTRFKAALSKRKSTARPTAVEIVEAALSSAQAAGASDIHLIPSESGLDMLWRLDGVLHPVDHFSKDIAANIVARLKVLAELLTYRVDVPQEGRIRTASLAGVEMRVSSFPTLFGEKAVVRLFVGSSQLQRLGDLGLPEAALRGCRDILLESGGVVLVSGPAGSGKTTTIYACLRELVDKFGATRSLVSLEDPIESVVMGVAQSQINTNAGFDYEVGLKSLMRQDPEVILVGEIRDQRTAETVFQAALTGHLVLTTFHAGSAAGAICRLSDMGIEPYLLRTGLLGILSQRLARRLCACAVDSNEDTHRMGFNLTHYRLPVGCDACRGTGYQGRLLLAEFLRTEDSAIGKAILSRTDADELESLAIKAGMISRWQHAVAAMESGSTSPVEVRRVLGFGRKSE